MMKNIIGILLSAICCLTPLYGEELRARPENFQQILDAVQPGDCVILTPGVYYGPFTLNRTGSPEKPVTIRADRVERGRVIFTCADRSLREGKINWECEDRELMLYSVPFGHNPVRVLYSGTDLMPYSTLEGLKSFSLLTGCPGPRHGFFYAPAEKKLYVRLHAVKYGPVDPNRHLMAAGPVTAPGYNGEKISKPEHANLTILPKKEGHIIIDGITFETPGGTGVLTYASDVTLRNAWFDGCRFGIFGGGSNDALPARITVEHSFYHNKPCFADVADLINEYRDTPVLKNYSIFWWHRKGSYCDRNIMKNYETGIAGGIGKDWVIRRNLFSDAFEGVSTWGNSWSIGLQVYENLFENIVDNALEAENHAADMTIRNNLFRNCFEPISWQPLDGTPWPGPVYVYDNLICTTPEFRALWPWRPSAFKIGASDRNWNYPRMGGLKDGEEPGPVSKRFVAVPGDGFLAFNNTVFFEHGYFMSTPAPIERELVNFRFFNNICVVAGFHRLPAYRGSLIEFYSNLVVSGGNRIQTELLAGTGGSVLGSEADLKLTDYSPAQSSPADTPGIRTIHPAAHSYIGAVAPGQRWELPRVGPLEEGK